MNLRTNNEGCEDDSVGFNLVGPVGLAKPFMAGQIKFNVVKPNGNPVNFDAPIRIEILYQDGSIDFKERNAQNNPNISFSTVKGGLQPLKIDVGFNGNDGKECPCGSSVRFLVSNIRINNGVDISCPINTEQTLSALGCDDIDD